MSNLFTAVSAEQQEMVAGGRGRRDRRPAPFINIRGNVGAIVGQQRALLIINAGEFKVD